MACRARIGRSALGCLLVASITAAFAAPAPAQTEDAATPTPLALSEIAEQAEAADETIRAVRQQLQPDPKITAIESVLPEQLPRIDELLAELREVGDEGAAPGRLEELDREFRVQSNALGERRGLIADRLEDLEESLTSIAQLRGVWAATRTQATRDGAPASIRETLDAMVTTLLATEREVANRRSLLLVVQNQIAQQSSRIADATERIAARRTALRGRVFQRDGPPLWSAFQRAMESAETPLGPARAALATDAKAFREYVGRQPDRLLVHGAVLLALLVLTLWMWRHRAAWLGENEELEASRTVLDHPVASAVLVALILTPVVHPLAPPVIEDLAGLGLVIPVVTLLPRMVSRALHPAVYGLAGFYLVDQLRGFVDPGTALARSVFAIETAAAAGVLVWMTRPARLTGLPTGVRLPKSLGLALRAGLALLVVALGANIVGFVSLGYVAGEGTLNSAYIALVLFGGFRASQAIMRVLLRTRALRQLRMVRTHPALILRRGSWLLGVAALGAWAYLSATTFQVRDFIETRVSAAAGASVRFGEYEISLGDVIAFGLTIFAAFVLARIIRFVLDEDVLPRIALPRGVGHAVSASARYLVLLFGFVLALAAGGLDLNRFTILAGAFGVGIGFGLQNVVNNFVSGLILLFERPVQVGDAVEVKGAFGEVKRIGIRSSTVRTFQGAEVIVPNANLISEEVVNWTLSDQLRRLEIRVGVEYGTDPKRVLALLEEVAKANPDVKTYPPPLALFLGFGDSSLDFELRAWTGRFETYLKVQSDVTIAINDALAAADITVPFPQRDLYLKSVPDAAARGQRPTERGPDDG